jgi:hypothetical protein
MALDERQGGKTESREGIEINEHVAVSDPNKRSIGPADPEGKISRIVENLVRYYHESQDTRGVQVLYIDTNCPRGKAA